MSFITKIFFTPLRKFSNKKDFTPYIHPYNYNYETHKDYTKE